MEIAVLAGTQVLGWVFVTAGADKLAHLARFATEIAGLPVVMRSGRNVRTAIALIVGGGELGLGVSLLLGIAGQLPLLLSSAALLSFTAMLLWVRRRPLASACGCGGIMAALGGRTHIAANIGLSLLAAALGVGGVTVGTVSTGAVALATVASTLALLLLHVIAALGSVRGSRIALDRRYIG